ncbi:MAG: hypothetical protein K9G44_08035, partial [Melioribacteraceae bacterium]|nr:hypothetical protein [Melioribacteraceae bacterium]
MFKNYFYLNRGIVELREKLIGKAIYEIYTQEKDQIFIRLESEHETFDHLILSCVPHLPYFLLRSDHRKAKKNTINFFDSFLPSKIVDLSIAENDRIIKIELEFSSLFFLIRGGSSNVVMFSENTAEAFQKKEHATLAELHTEISKINFIKGYNQAHFINPKSFEDLKNLRKSFPFVPKELIQNVGITAGEDESLISEEFQNSLKMILYQDIIIGELEGKTSFSPNNFVKHDGFNQKYILDNYNDAVQKFIQNYHYSGRKV